MSKWEMIPLSDTAEICDSLRKPINAKERQRRIDGKSISELYPYYGATGQVGFIDEYLVDDEYVLLGEDGAPFLNPFAEKAYIIRGKAWVNNHAHLLKSKTNNKFLCFYLNHFDYNGYVSGTTRLKLTQAQMRQIPIPDIPILEQDRIVSHIEELFSELDKAVETLQTTKKQLAIYRKAVLKEAFFLTTSFVPLGKISFSRLGKMLDKTKNKGKPRKYLRNINVRWFSFDLSDLLEMKIEDDEIEQYSIHKDDLVICEGGEPGRCAVWKKDDAIFYQKALHRLRFTSKSIPEFYMYYLWFMSQTGGLNPYFTGTGIKHLTGQSLVKIPVPDMGWKEQEVIVEEIKSRLSICDSIEKTVDAALLQAEAMRQSILKQAFEGDLFDEQNSDK